MDLLSYELYCAKEGKVDPEALLPWRTPLRLHMKRASYQASIWRRAVISHPDVPSPHGHDWKVCGASKLVEFVWLGTKPVPEEVLELLSCTCKRVFSVETCCCLKAGLKCTYCVLCNVRTWCQKTFLRMKTQIEENDEDADD